MLVAFTDRLIGVERGRQAEGRAALQAVRRFLFPFRGEAQGGEEGGFECPHSPSVIPLLWLPSSSFIYIDSLLGPAIYPSSISPPAFRLQYFLCEYYSATQVNSATVLPS